MINKLRKAVVQCAPPLLASLASRKKVSRWTPTCRLAFWSQRDWGGDCCRGAQCDGADAAGWVLASRAQLVIAMLRICAGRRGFSFPI